MFDSPALLQKPRRRPKFQNFRHRSEMATGPGESPEFRMGRLANFVHRRDMDETFQVRKSWLRRSRLLPVSSPGGQDLVHNTGNER